MTEEQIREVVKIVREAMRSWTGSWVLGYVTIDTSAVNWVCRRVEEKLRRNRLTAPGATRS